MIGYTYTLQYNNIILYKLYTWYGMKLILFTLYFLYWGVKCMFFLRKHGWTKP